MIFFWLGVAGMILLAALTLWRVSVDDSLGDELSPLTVALVWTLYALQFALELFAALNRYYPIRVAPIPFIFMGSVFIVAGTALYSLGLLHLGSIRRMSGVDTSRLVTSGVYAWSRNPQNVGWILFLFGIGLIARSMLAILLALFFAVLFAFYAPMEENHLEAIFGDTYRIYKKRSHRYFGFPKK